MTWRRKLAPIAGGSILVLAAAACQPYFSDDDTLTAIPLGQLTTLNWTAAQDDDPGALAIRTVRGRHRPHPVGRQIRTGQVGIGRLQGAPGRDVLGREVVRRDDVDAHGGLSYSGTGQARACKPSATRFREGLEGVRR